MPKLCEMTSVRGDDTGFPVELWRDNRTGRLVVRAYNEAGYSFTEIDVWDLIGWLRHGPERDFFKDASAIRATRDDTQ